MMLAFFSIIKNRDGDFSVNEGSLFSLPPELKDLYRMKSYREIKNNGWHTTEFGYSTFVKSDTFGNQYILPGLYLTDAARPKKKFHGYEPNFSKAQIEKYLENHFSRKNEAYERADEELTALVHDLRHLSSSIYHSATEAQNALNNTNYRQASDSLKTVIATQTMLKVRTDYLDFSNDTDRFMEIDKIPVFSRVDKVVRCFRASARSRSMHIELSGKSYRLAEGPNILDIVPYTIIDNAIKYGRKGSKVDVQICDTEKDTIVSITSYSPSIHESEQEKIFERGVRGVNAKKVHSTGTGIGLSVAKKIVEIFRGKISVRVNGEHNSFDGVAYRDISFVFSIPTLGEDERKREKFRRRNIKKIN